jgi:hypothetical protein
MTFFWDTVKGTLALCGAMGLFFSSFAASAEGLRLAVEGKSDYIIVLPDRPTAVEKTAVRELQEHLAKATGATLPIVGENQAAAEKPQIVVGASERMKRLQPGLDLDSLGRDGIVIQTAGKDLVLAGQGPRGTLYAVYTFLEDVVGCQWWTSTESFVPKRPTLAVGALNVRYAPKLYYREAYYRDALDGIFSARCKCNGHSNRATPQYGGHYAILGFVHTFYPLLPPKKYFDKHPEWYSEIAGRRVCSSAQLCLTNESMRKELVSNALAWLRNTPGAGFISISQNDCRGNCQCAKCKAVEAEEGAPSGLLLRFVNAVAEDIEKEFPDVLVETLAYQYTRKLPKHARPRSNVVVRLCTIESCRSQPVEGPENTSVLADLSGWSKVAPRLFIWDYTTNFSNYLVPHPNYRVLAPNIRCFVRHNAVGLFEQGDCGSSIGDFIRLRAWLLAHLMWNPNLDEKTLVDDFMQGYYGAAAPHLMAYFNAIADAGERSPKSVGCFMENTSGWLTLEDMNKATRAFDKAQAAVADHPALLERVRRERLALDYAWLVRYPALKDAAERNKLDFLGPKDPVAATRAFIEQAEKYNAGSYREGASFAEEAERLRRRFRRAAPPKLCENLPASDWVDLQDGEFRLGKPGKYSETVDDPIASDGKAIRMPGSHSEWEATHSISNDIALRGPWHCYAAVRCESKAKDGPAMAIGIYNDIARKNVLCRVLSVGDTAGADYRVIDLGKHKLTSAMRIWFAPPKRPGEVESVYLDRVFLIREK